MDNKITKKRLNDFLAYDWIIIIAVIVAAIFLWELLFNFVEVRPTAGQGFKYYFDDGVNASGNEQIYKAIGLNEPFSYDVLDLQYEELTNDVNVIRARMQVQDGDVIFSSTDDENTTNDRAKSFVDSQLSFKIYALEDLVSDAEKYLTGFLIDGASEITKENLSSEKIEKHFRERMKKDNRFRKEEQILVGIEQEKARIENLVKETADLKYLLTVGDDIGLFFRYTMFEQISAIEGNEGYKPFYEEEIANGRKDMAYGINMAKLTGGKYQSNTYVKLDGASTADGVVMMVFNFLEYQPDLQFETISFINMFVRECSDLYKDR